MAPTIRTFFWCSQSADRVARTDMGGENARLSGGEGASGVVWLATEAPRSLTGKFFKERKEVSW